MPIAEDCERREEEAAAVGKMEEVSRCSNVRVFRDRCIVDQNTNVLGLLFGCNPLSSAYNFTTHFELDCFWGKVVGATIRWYECTLKITVKMMHTKL